MEDQWLAAIGIPRPSEGHRVLSPRWQPFLRVTLKPERDFGYPISPVRGGQHPCDEVRYPARPDAVGGAHPSPPSASRRSPSITVACSSSGAPGLGRTGAIAWSTCAIAIEQCRAIALTDRWRRCRRRGAL